MRILFLFFDGLGLGDDDSERNPLAAADLPTLNSFTGGHRWLRGLTRHESERGTFISIDACLGVDGKPQSATGQATIMTGINVPWELGYHYGPKPNSDIAAIVRRESVVKKLTQQGLRARLVNAYPSRFLDSIKRGKRLPSSNQMAMQVAGVKLPDGEDFLARRALSTDFTGRLWREYAAYNDAASKVWRVRMGGAETPVLSPFEAGQLLADLASESDFTLFDHWVTDYLGHRGTMEQAVELLTLIDTVLFELLSAWDDSAGLIVLTSDHGNIEDLDERGHTRNPVPALVIGEARHEFIDGLVDLTGFASSILHVLNGS